jgi:NADH dehydrogenase/NADH:ubiquinone oxidoreductase subunit G
MSSPGPLFRPYDKLVKITVKGCQVEVPSNNMLLRALQYVASENIAYGRFCWNEECQYCRITYDMGEGTPSRTAISCKLIVEEGMRITQMDTELRYCLRELFADAKKP